MTAPRSSAGVAMVISLISPTKMKPWPTPEPSIASTVRIGSRMTVAGEYAEHGPGQEPGGGDKSEGPPDRHGNAERHRAPGLHGPCRLAGQAPRGGKSDRDQRQMDNKGELELGGTILHPDTSEKTTQRQPAGHARGRRQRGKPLRAFMSRNSTAALSLKVAVAAAVAKAIPKPCTTRAANSPAVSCATTNKTSPAPNERRPATTSTRRPMTSDNGPKIASPGKMTATAAAYSSVWVSDEYPNAARNTPYSALGKLLPMNSTASAIAAPANACLSRRGATIS